MKSLLTISKVLFLLSWMLIAIPVKAQAPTFSCYITNEQLLSPSVYQFDIYLLNTGSTDIEYAAAQWGITVNPAVTNGGILTASIINGSSSLTNSSQVHTSVQLPTSTFVFNVAAKAPPGPGNGSIISKTNGGCSSPGTRIATCKITNSTPFAPGTMMDHLFNFTSGSGRTATMVYAYVGGINTDITANGTFYSYNTSGSCLKNIPLNNEITGVKNVEAENMGASVYPNPSNKLTTLTFSSKTSTDYHMSLVDEIGREVMVKEGKAVVGKNSVEIDLSNLAKGVYQLNLKSGHDSSVVTTVVE